MIDLPNVTLVAVSSVAIRETIAAMRRSSQGISYARSILFTHENPRLDPLYGIEWQEISRLESRAEYSRFMLHSLADYIDTEHALCIQWDGFVIRPAAWTTKFLEFDYIGARWPQFADRHIVGNGGFSLRSRRLLQASKSIQLLPNESEDIAICRRCRPTLEQMGLHFATPEIADLFSYERSMPRGNEFGFHGVFNFLPIMGSDGLRRFVADLDPKILGERERRDLLKQSLRALDFRLAHQLLRLKRHESRSNYIG
jgi:Protein of unknown function (DUF5672)